MRRCFLITIVHGAQSGVDRGAHDAALVNGWRITGYMPRDARDEFGPIPPDVARHLTTHDKPGYPARTAANVRLADAVLIVVPNASDPHSTPGTSQTINTNDRRLPCMVADPGTDPALVARWIWSCLLSRRTLALPLEVSPDDAPRLLVAGPRESKWQGARAETAALLQRVARDLGEISCRPRGASTR